MRALTIFIAVSAGSYLLAAWLMMLGVGMIHADWLHTMPTMSWHAALVLAWIPGIFLGGSGASSARRNR